MQKIRCFINYNLRHVERERDLHNFLTVTSAFACELVRNPRVETERKLAELELISEPREMKTLRRVIDVLEAHGKRLTQLRLDSMCGGRSGGFDLDAFRDIAKAARVYKILTNTTDRRGTGYGLFEWIN
jgi:hypothetical protein